LSELNSAPKNWQEAHHDTRWDSERELFLQRNRAHTTKYKTYCPTKWKFTKILSW